MGSSINLSGTAQLQSGTIDLHQIGALTATLVTANHAFKLEPTAVEGEGWQVTVTVDLQGANSLRLLRDLQGAGVFDD